MAVVLDSYVKRCAAALEEFAGQEACGALGIRDNVRGLLGTLARIDAVVSHEERRRVLSSRVDAWVVLLKDVMYEVDDVLDVCAAEGAKILADDHPPAPKVRCAFMFSCFRYSGPQKFHHEIGFTIRDIDIRLREIEDEMPPLPAAGASPRPGARRDWFNSEMSRSCHDDVVKPRSAVGTQVQKSLGGLVPRLLREGKKKVDVFAIVGAVGIGKTTLAREIFTDERMTENFPICVWVKMSKDLSEAAFLKKIIAGAGVNAGDTENKEELLGLLSSALSKRYLNLDGTQLSDLPSSVGFLVNLQTLSLEGCQRLQKLPWSISELQELRCLCLEGTSLRYVPKGVGELKHLNHLSGLIIGQDNNDPEGCDLIHLRAMSELRYLQIERLDRATSGASALANKPFLKVLHLSEQAALIEEEENEEEQENQEGAEKEEKDKHEVKSAQWIRDDSAKVSEKIWNELTPPNSVEKLVIKNYQGRKFPNWMAGPKLNTSFPALAFLDLDNCMSCTTLPALGRLKQLKSLEISNADSIVAIGSEFLGTTVISQAISFPKLEVLKLRNMKNLEDWSLSVEESQTLLPCLKSLHIQFCPKLKALPEGLKDAALCDLHVEGAHCLTEIKDLPKLSDELYLKDNRALLRISNLPALKSLTIDDCAKLKHVSGLDMLQHLRLVFPPSTETYYFEELVIFWNIAFPRWLELLIRLQANGLRRFELQCALPLLRSCLEGGKNWHVVQQIPEVRITSTDGKKYIRYNKARRIYETNAQCEEKST
ncbi:hypothetical protein CFC21_100788 [Triticum aestivum]|uniref:NB-ARC domain-containing protein n=2 Tax=Triticum aestivum TaxID=4565 RepID=A0A9R1N3C2_WHEAT|nr:hypothetical protein CFC21_100785 [Triticum aestivum]KAF7099103.1 hypothetical protein CFC21_100788 [Triticum aestivum]